MTSRYYTVASSGVRTVARGAKTLATELEICIRFAGSTAGWRGVRAREAGIVTGDGVTSSRDCVVAESCEALTALVALEDGIETAGETRGRGTSTASLTTEVTFLASSGGIHVVARSADTNAVDQLCEGFAGGTVVGTTSEAGGTSQVAGLAVAGLGHVVVESLADAGALRCRQCIGLAGDAARR